MVVHEKIVNQGIRTSDEMSEYPWIDDASLHYYPTYSICTHSS